jgi:hypothetical protein
MDKRYYGFKALLLSAAFVAAIAGGGLECSRLGLSLDTHYQAAVEAQATVHAARVKVTRALGQIFSQVFADL